MEQYTITAFVTVFSSLLTFYLAFNVGTVRRKSDIGALEISKDKKLLTAIRTHMNMVENMVVFLPLLWLATVYWPSNIAGIIGAIWFISRVIYSFAYMSNPKTRTIPFVVGVACIVITAIMGLYGIVF